MTGRESASEESIYCAAAAETSSVRLVGCHIAVIVRFPCPFPWALDGTCIESGRADGRAQLHAPLITEDPRGCSTPLPSPAAPVLRCLATFGLPPTTEAPSPPSRLLESNRELAKTWAPPLPVAVAAAPFLAVPRLLSPPLRIEGGRSRSHGPGPAQGGARGRRPLPPASVISLVEWPRESHRREGQTQHPVAFWSTLSSSRARACLASKLAAR